MFITRKLCSILEINKKNKLNYECIKICITYFLIGFLWIYLSEKISHKLANDKGMLLIINIYKGWLYVIVTSIILYLLIKSLLKKVDLAEKKLNESYKELSSVNKNLESYIQQLNDSEEELKKSEEKNRAIIRAIPDLLFIIDNNGYFIDCMSSDKSNLLLPRERFIGKTIHEIFPEEISKIAYKKIHSLLRNGLLESFEYKIKISNKEQYFEVRLIKNNEKEILAISRNITIEKQNKLNLKISEEALKTSENRFRNIFENSSDGILIIVDDKITDCNIAMLKLLGYDSKSCILGKKPCEFYPEKQPDGKISEKKVVEMRKRTIENGNWKFEWWYKRSDGKLLPVEVMLTTISINGKKFFHSLWRDISTRKQMEQKMKYLSYHDQLTGLYNRRFFEEELKRLDTEENFPLTIVMADVNGLKLVNDSLGHAVGDELLKKVSEVMINGCKANGIVARLGGDEFVILLPKTCDHETDQIIKHIKSEALKQKIGAVDISISFGYETKKNEEEKIEKILKKAEDYMYKKKLFEGPSMRGKTINAIISTLHEKNKREEQHSHRVSELCKDTGKALGLLDGEIEELKNVGLLHDIGKIAIEENILNKNGKLTDDEWKEIKKHPEIGYRILNTVNDMSEMAEYVLAHHERWDGTGYPKGLKRKEIPLQSRIIAIADSYDAMISKRSYRDALTEDVAIKELKENAGSQFDPELTKIFIEKVLHKQFD